MSLVKKFAALVFFTALANCPGQAQQPSAPSAPDQPLPPASTDQAPSNSTGGPAVPAARSFWGSDAPAQATDPTAYIPDSRPLSGSSELTAGQPESHVDLFDASFDLAFGGGNNLPNSGNRLVFGTESILGGDLSYDHTWRQNSFAASYDAGGIIYDPSSAAYGNGMFHSLSVGEQLVGARWVVRLVDDGLYSANASVGGAGMGGPGLLGNFPGPFSGLIPDFGGIGETILTGSERRINNTSIAEAEYLFTRRSSITISGSYDVLHFFDAGFINNNTDLGRVGYNYQLSQTNAVAFYGQAGYSSYSLFSTSGAGPGGSGTPPILSHITEYGGGVAFAHQLTGRMAFQISGGPNVEEFPTVPGAISSNHWNWEANAALSYSLPRSSISLSYFHGPTQGAGVYSGTSSHIIQSSYSHRLTHFLSSSLYGGYVRNGALAAEAGFSNQISNWYAGASLGRQVGQRTSFAIYYGAQQQASSGQCPVASCGLTALRQTFGITVNWHVNPIPLE